MHVQSLQQALQELIGLHPWEAARAPGMCQTWAKQGLRKAANKAPKAFEGSQSVGRQAVEWYAQDMAVDMQGFVATEVVQKQLQIMCVCFEGLCHEVQLTPHLLLATCVMVNS